MDTLDRELQRDAGMPHAYYEILVRLSEAPDRRLRMSELAEATGSSRSRLSHAVARLEAAGWVRREELPHRPTRPDRRPHRRTVSRPWPPPLPATSRAYADTCSTLLSPAQVDQLRRISETLVEHLDPNRPTS